jgi:hypothetical protein
MTLQLFVPRPKSRATVDTMAVSSLVLDWRSCGFGRTVVECEGWILSVSRVVASSWVRSVAVTNMPPVGLGCMCALVVAGDTWFLVTRFRWYFRTHGFLMK